jgi:hypothetical protein
MSRIGFLRMVTKSLPDTDHIVRHVPSKLLDETGKPLPQAYELRPSETYLSASWSEYFQGSLADRLAGCASMMSHYRTLKPRDALSVGNIGEIKDAFGEYNQKIRIVSEHDGLKGLNLAYSAVRQVQTENLDLLELLAQDVWNDVHPAAGVLSKVGPWQKR